ncbi:MAG: hypothetical protein PHN47_08260 [Clostridia bacterium]|jgi:hypothetical protein|nr:hypothetical protein [Clostridia bacterium]
MKHYCCPLSLDASSQIKALTESYRLAIAAASDYNTISLASRKQVEAAIARADRLGEAIDCYLNGWQRGIPCLLYSCGWEYCRRNLEILNSLPNLPKIPPKPKNNNNFNSNNNPPTREDNDTEDNNEIQIEIDDLEFQNDTD